MFQGIGASPGIVVGKALVYKHRDVIIERTEINDVSLEINKFEKALKETRLQLEESKEITLKKFDQEIATIFEAHIMVLEDPELLDRVKNKIMTEKVNIEYALRETIKEFVALFENIEDEYIKERASDVMFVGTKIINNIMGIESVDLGNISKPIVLIAHDLTPSDTAAMNRENVLGFLTNIGGKTGHTAIMARSLEVPAIVALRNITELVEDEDTIVFDGEQGVVYVNPPEEIMIEYYEKQRKYQIESEELKKLKDNPTVTIDGRRVELAGNIGTPQDVKAVLDNGGEGIGLYRTEFLYMDRNQLPTEEEQFNAYKKVLEKMDNKPVVIRTLDIGGDKDLPYLEFSKEMNPFLGYRAIRICLDQPEIFKTQLRALLRASVYGNLKIMFPMISSVDEIRAAKNILNEVKYQLEEQGIEYNDTIEVGIMMEIPVAAIIGDLLIKEVDFFSIGTNDLIQYSVAVDRTNEKVAYLYEPFHPGILRMIKMIIDHAHGAGKWVGMCGEMAGDPELIPVLLGLGLDEFSMSGSAILRAKNVICNSSYKDMKAIVEKALELSTAEEVKAYITGQLS